MKNMDNKRRSMSQDSAHDHINALIENRLEDQSLNNLNSHHSQHESPLFIDFEADRK